MFVGDGGIMGQAFRGGRRTLFQGLMVTVDKEWVGVLAEKWLPGGFWLLDRWSLQRCFLSVLLLSLSLRVHQAK